VALSPEQLGSLRAAKLRSIVTTRSGPGDRTGGSFPRGAALLDATTAWVLIDEAGPRSLGGALAWARRAGADRAELVL